MAFMRLVLGKMVTANLMAELGQFNSIVLFPVDVADTVDCLANNQFPIFLGLEP